MVNSRKDGKLYVSTNSPYKVSSDGNYVEKNIICCKEFGYEQEWTAVSLYQMVMSAIMSNPLTKDQAVKQTSSEEIEDISKIESPSAKQVEELGNGYKMFLLTNPSISIKIFMSTFEELITAGLIQTDTEKVIGLTDWKNGVNWDDKLKIACCYVGFFVTPSQNA